MTEIKEEKKARSTRNRGKRKVKESDVSAENLAQTVISESAEIAPVIAPDAAQTEATVVSETAEQVQSEEKETKPKKTRRPNRNSQKRTRKKKDAEE